MTLYLTQDEVKEVLDMKSTFEAVEGGFREMGNDNIEMPPRVYLHFEKGVLILFQPYVQGYQDTDSRDVSVDPSLQVSSPMTSGQQLLP